MLVRTLLLGILAGSTALAGVCDGITDRVLQKHAPIPPYKVMSKREVNGLCEMILNINGQFVPITRQRILFLQEKCFQTESRLLRSR